jgi:hypothetical protein
VRKKLGLDNDREIDSDLENDSKYLGLGNEFRKCVEGWNG